MLILSFFIHGLIKFLLFLSYFQAQESFYLKFILLVIVEKKIILGLNI